MPAEAKRRVRVASDMDDNGYCIIFDFLFSLYIYICIVGTQLQYRMGNLQRQSAHFARILFVITLLHTLPFCQSSKVALFPRHARNAKPFASVTKVRGGSSQSRRWERMDGRDLGGNSLPSSLLTASGANIHGRACGFYIWDLPSALLHRWCHHLLKDCVYEGLGGRKVCKVIFHCKK